VEAELKKFHAWLVGRGREPETAEGYCREVRLATSESSLTDRIIDRSLAPKTRRRIVASLRSWAKFKGDGELLITLSDVRLPPPKRKTVRRPFPREEWMRIVDAIQDDEDMEPALRAVCMIVCLRGLRVGDVLRMHRNEVRQAIKTGRLVIEAKRGHMVDYTAKPMLEAMGLLMESPVKWDQVEDLLSPEATHKRRAARKRVHAALRRVAEELSIDPVEVYPHRFRRTYAVNFLQQMQGDPQAMQKLVSQMQWLNPATALEYTDWTKIEELDAIDEKVRRKS
jgi:site-specific recombinase XerD